jgi:hypothetical protein
MCLAQLYTTELFGIDEQYMSLLWGYHRVVGLLPKPNFGSLVADWVSIFLL